MRPFLLVLSSIAVNDGASQRSQVMRLTLNFDRPVILTADATTLGRLNTGGSGLNDGSAQTDATDVLNGPTATDGGLSWTFTFGAGSPFFESAGSLAGPRTPNQVAASNPL